MTIPERLETWFRSLSAHRRRVLVIAGATVIVGGAVGIGFALGGGGQSNVGTSVGSATTATTYATVTTSTTEEPTTTEPVTAEPTTTLPVPVAITSASLMSMIGRPATSQELSALKTMCYRSFDFGQDVHCEAAAGFGLSFDNGAVREVYLYNYEPPDQESFPGSLPGDVTWDSTLSDITGTLGQPDCVSSIIGFDANYDIDGYDVEYTVEASHEPTARLQKITIRSLDDRPTSCHAPTWEVGS